MSEIGSPQSLAPGSLIQEFKVVRTLGEGAFAIVYLAENQYLPETVAIKEFFHAELAQRMSDGTVTPRSPAAEETFRWALDKFLVEAQILYELGQDGGHPNIVRVRRFHETNGTAYMVMDFEEGEALEDRLEREGTLSEQALLPILNPLLDALDWAHSKSVWHRDIKPANIVIRPDGSPVLFDFGAARKDRGDGAVSQIAVFTPNYAAPEQESGLPDSMGPWTDIYSLGATLYRAVVGRLPTNATRRALNEDHVPAIQAAAGKGYTDTFLTAIDRALELSPAKRPQSVAEWRHDFQGVPALAHPAEGGDTVLRPSPKAAAAPVDHERTRAPYAAEQGTFAEQDRASGSSSTGPPEASAPGRPKRRLAYVAAGVVVIGMAAIGTFAFLDGRTSIEKTEKPETAGAADSARRASTPGVADKEDETTGTPEVEVTVADVVNGLAPDAVKPSPRPEPSIPATTTEFPRYVPPATSDATVVAEVQAPPPRAPELAKLEPPAPTVPTPNLGEAQDEPPRGAELAKLEPPASIVAMPDPGEAQDEPPRGAELAKLEPLSPALSAPNMDDALMAAQRLAEAVDCSYVDVSLAGDSKLDLIGFVTTQRDLDGLVSGMLALDGVAAVQNNVQIVIRPFCEALKVLVAHTLGAAQEPVIDLENSDGSYREGQFLQLTAGASTAFDGYLYVDYIDGEGNVLHFLPSARFENNRVSAGQKILLGRKPRFMVGPPHGKSMFVAISSKQPLFDKLRPEIEPLAQYLPALEARLKARTAQQGKAEGIASTTRFIVTTP